MSIKTREVLLEWLLSYLSTVISTHDIFQLLLLWLLNRDNLFVYTWSIGCCDWFRACKVLTSKLTFIDFVLCFVVIFWCFFICWNFFFCWNCFICQGFFSWNLLFCGSYFFCQGFFFCFSYCLSYFSSSYFLCCNLFSWGFFCWSFFCWSFVCWSFVCWNFFCWNFFCWNFFCQNLICWSSFFCRNFFFWSLFFCWYFFLSFIFGGDFLLLIRLFSLFCRYNFAFHIDRFVLGWLLNLRHLILIFSSTTGLNFIHFVLSFSGIFNRF